MNFMPDSISLSLAHLCLFVWYPLSQIPQNYEAKGLYCHEFVKVSKRKTELDMGCFTIRPTAKSYVIDSLQQNAQDTALCHRDRECIYSFASEVCDQHRSDPC